MGARCELRSDEGDEWNKNSTSSRQGRRDLTLFDGMVRELRGKNCPETISPRFFFFFWERKKVNGFPVSLPPVFLPLQHLFRPSVFSCLYPQFPQHPVSARFLPW